MNETPVTFDLPSNITLDQHDTSTVSICITDHKKTHFTVILSC